MADLNIFSQFTRAANALSNIITVTPEPFGYQVQPLTENENAQPKFLFHYEGDNTLELSSEITDHYVEVNEATHDHIALRPEVVSVEGFIGELNNVTPEPLQTARRIAEKLTAISGYTPQVSQFVQRTYNLAEQAYNAASTISDVAARGWGTEPIITEQQKAFNFFYAAWRERRFFTLQTPWAIFNNMAILNLRAVQEDRSAHVSSFQVDFKKLRFVEEPQFDFVERNSQGRLTQQNATPAEIGLTTPTEESSLTDRFRSFDVA